ncbi:MAG: RecQ family zinc-binding domain-containing protein, partial [Gaiellaceae bacterium]
EHEPGAQFAISEYDLSTRHDVRPLVLKTILTYLELDGLLEQGTPFYAGYSVRPASGEWHDVYATFDPDRADFLRRVLESGKEGRIWTGVDPDAVPGEERERVVKALGYLEQQGLVELKVADVRQRFTLLRQPPSLAELRDRLADRFDRREQSEAERIERVVALVEHDGCQVQSLVGYFGETRADQCGHCSHCLTGSVQSVPQLAATPELQLDRAVLDELTAEYPTALGTPRQRARFLCGLASPATTKAKLSRHALFGALAEHRFADVLALT